ncbi:DUF6114 domain-containing protein [Corynebacterium sp. MSK297]|uniref:DUF6114 domain-containing protein n=1 Tax=Corynebacterium sp. MSK297 TaxID=3050221 RepID=UPI00254C0A59|nr:DUF6114 domain-containing protein [Corynebacterium sp. MSK297]MDK8846109.1 DUF6114 domain-containing protein [Corynebacterium sp. MSK297]
MSVPPNGKSAGENSLSGASPELVTEQFAKASAAEAPQSMTGRFRRWRRGRPFMGGLFMILAGVIILAPAYLSFQIQDLLVVVSAMSGVSTLLIGIMLIMSGIGVWVRPDLTVFAGILALVLAVVSLPASNFGGFIIGALFGIIGGSLAIAWDERDRESVKKDRRKKKADKTNQKRRQASTNAEPHAQDSSAAHNTTSADNQKKKPTDLTLDELLGNSSTTKSVLAVALALAASIAVVSAPQPYAEAQVDPVAPSIVGVTQPVTADEVTVSGNAKIAIVIVETQQGPQKMIELSGNAVSVDNIAFDLPGRDGAVSALTSGPGTTATLKGNPAVLRTRILNATPAIAGVETIPLRLDAAGNIDELTDQLVAAGLTELAVPDAVMNHISLRDVSLEALSVDGDVLDAPNLSVHAR